jgi:hypothetical protein
MQMQMLDPILSLVQLHAQVRGRKYPSSHTGAAYDGDAGEVLHKKLKVFSSSSLIIIPVHVDPVNDCISRVSKRLNTQIS